jgi:hypothetical protein
MSAYLQDSETRMENPTSSNPSSRPKISSINSDLTRNTFLSLYVPLHLTPLKLPRIARLLMIKGSGEFTKLASELAYGKDSKPLSEGKVRLYPHRKG